MSKYEFFGDNLWGFFNGITYYNTHVKKDYSRNFNLFGLSNKINKIAYDLCCLCKYQSQDYMHLNNYQHNVIS